MRIAVVTPMMKSGERGGAEALYDGLVGGLRQESHDVDQVAVMIDESSFDAILESYAKCEDLDLGRYDVVVSTKAPTYMVRHPNHVSYLLHTIRVFYDMFEYEFGAGTPELRKQRRLIHELDKQGLHPDRVRGHFANGRTTFERLYEADPFWRGVAFRALHHPPALEGFHEPGPGQYVFLPGRLHRWKRANLVIESLKHLDRDVSLKVVGTGEDEPALRALAGGDPRVEFLGRVDDARLLDLYSRALVVPFVPRMEDYGLITIEAFLGGKPVLTCRDSGEPTHFVKDYETGLVVEPDPRAIAEGLAYFVDHPEQAAAMGRRGAEAASAIDWRSVIGPLLAAARPEAGRDRSRSAPSLVAPPAEAGGPVASPGPDELARAAAGPDASGKAAYRVCVLDMQPIDPPLGGGRIRLLGLYHGLGESLPTTYIGTYDWPGEKDRRHRLSPTLEEVDVTLGEPHFAAAAEWTKRAGGKTIIDSSFDLLAHHSPRFVQAARAEVESSEIVVFSHPWIYPLVEDLLRPRSQLVVYDSQNVEGLLRASLLDDGGFGTEMVEHVVRVEAELCRAADLILACSHEDRALFHELYGIPYGKVVVVPNGTFTRRATPPGDAEKAEAKRRLGLEGRRLAVFLGSAYTPNVEAAEFIRGRLAPALPDVTFAICGGVGQALDSTGLGGDGPENVLVTGLLDESQKADYLAAADVAVNPMFSGSGTNIKMFDFMAVGLPVVSTPVGARGIACGAEAAFLAAPGPQFADAVRRVLDDRDLGRALAGAGRRLAEEKYSWERISARLGEVLRRAKQTLAEPRPLFTVACATYERHEQLTELMGYLREQSCKDFEVVLVDQSARPWPDRDRFADLDIHYVHTDVKGAVKARNTAALFARGEVLAFTDDDCQPFDDWLENARRYFDDPEVVGVEGLILSDRRDDPNFRAVTNEGFEGIGFMTANLFIRREAFAALDGFDERFDHPHFREDTDLGWRACERGEVPFGHDVRVYHPPQPRSVEREGLAHRNRFFEKDALLLQKHPEKYRSLFLQEAHYRNTPGFSEHFLRGAEKFRVDIDDFYLNLLESRPVASGPHGDNATDFSVQPVRSYLSSFDRIEGMFSPDAALLLVAYNAIIASRGVSGDVMEIGVHHGLSSITIAALRGRGCRFVAVDLFEQLQEANVSASGSGNHDRFLENMGRYYSDLGFLDVRACPSSQLGPEDLGRGFSFCHVDGGHSSAETYGDLALCSRLLLPGGLLALDDYFNPAFPGVSEGAVRYMLDHPGDLKPIAIGFNKVVYQKNPTDYDINEAFAVLYPLVPRATAVQWEQPVLLFGSELRPCFDLDRTTPRRPVVKPDFALAARVQPLVTQISARAGEVARLPIRVKNDSPVAFQCGISPIGLSYHLFGDDGAMLQFDNRRSFFHHPLNPGEERVVDLLVTPPGPPGRYRIEVDIVWEGIAWFKDKGNPTSFVDVSVG